MTWLFPLYLLGGAAIIGPILMHLRRRPPQDRVEFSSLMFLDAQTPLPVSNRRLENWLLLLLRCLALLLLALMFARPLWRVENEGALSANAATVIVLDRSASMQRGDLWQQALAEATKRLALAAPTDRLACITFDHEPRVLWSFDQDKTAASSRSAVLQRQLSDTNLGWGATDLGKALVEAVGLFSRAEGLGGMKKKIVLITDLQEGSKIEALRTQVWPNNVVLEVLRVEAPNLDNISLSLAASENSQTGQNRDGAEVNAATMRVRLTNARDSKVFDYSLDTTPPTTGYLPPGASRVLSLMNKTGALLLTGDAWDFDNRIFIAPSQPKTVKIVFIGDEKTRSEAASPLYYLSRALQPTPSLKPELIVLPESAKSIPADTELVFISGARLSAGLKESMRTVAEQGGLVIAVVTLEMKTQDLEALTGISGIRIDQSDLADQPDQYQMLTDVQTAHPLLRPFADERLRDFTKLRFWKHRRLTFPKDAPLSVLARFDNGDPAMLTSTQGKGTFILLTSGWHPADSQLALSTKFVPLLYGWLEAAGFRNEEATSLLVGDVLPLEAATTIMTPDGKTLTPKLGETIRAELPGIYTLNKDRLVAVNIAPEEGRITPLDITKLRELGLRIEANDADATTTKTEDKERLAITEQEAQQRAWIWLLGSLLAILAWETWLAGRIRQGTLQTAYSSP